MAPVVLLLISSLQSSKLTTREHFVPGNNNHGSGIISLKLRRTWSQILQCTHPCRHGG